ncbi:MAG: hypothetical protein ACE5R6_09970 [Candidatus Heimdallarchaeota archaeon]
MIERHGPFDQTPVAFLLLGLPAGPQLLALCPRELVHQGLHTVPHDRIDDLPERRFRGFA